MIGGPSIEQPYYNPYQYAAPVYAQPQGYVQQPPTIRPAQPRTVPSNQQATLPRPPVARGQMSDEATARPTPRKLLPEMPSPEALGVPMPTAPLDWTDLRVRLDRIGATKFSLEQQADGYRFTCQVRTSDGLLRTVEGRAATETEAVQRALAQAGR